MDQQRSSLCVNLHNVEFAKDYHYFITVQLNIDGEKRRTDISAQVAAPVFQLSSFYIPLSNFKLEINDCLHFEAFVVTDREVGRGPELDNQGQARLLGECTLPLGQLTGALTDISGTGVRQHLKFTRKTDKQVTVGRFIVNLKLVGEQLLPIHSNDEKPLEQDEIFHPLPASDPFMNFSWRLRVDIRTAIDLPLNRATTHGLPRSFVELGWSEYDNAPPGQHQLYPTKLVENDRHPIWNQQFLIPNPTTNTKKEGYLFLQLVDTYVPQPIETVFFPIEAMTPFRPMNIELHCKYAEYEARPRLYLSITLEMINKEKFLDELCDIIVKNVHYNPLPYSKRTFLAMTLNQTSIKDVPFTLIDLLGPASLATGLDLAASDIFISSIMKVPPHKAEAVYNAVAVFTLPKSYLDRGIAFYLAGWDESAKSLHRMPNSIVGYTPIADVEIKKLYYSKEIKQALIPMTWDIDCKIRPYFTNSNCQVELACIESGDDPMHDSRNSSKRSTRKIPRTPDMANLANGIGDRDKWDLLSKELSQKQEMVHRLMKEVDDKTDSLKITGTEIVDLRRQVKLLQSENGILRKRLAHEESLEIQSIITKEIASMSMEELRQKIIKVAQAYRNERVRNEEFEKALKSAQKDIAQARQLELELEQLQRVHQENAKKMLAMQQEIAKVGAYKEAIKKQENVISKLEKLMETSLKDAQKARQAQLEVEQLKSENLNLQKQLKGIVYGDDIGEMEKYKSECQRLERIVANMKEELRNKRPVSNSGADWEQDKMELEVKLHRAHARIDALQDEMTYNAKNYAKEIAQLKLVIAEKQALLDSLTMGGFN